MDRKRKERLYQRLAYYPVLRLVVFNVWYRALALSVLLLVALGALCLLKVWPATPAGFLPAVKHSWLDRLQAWSLRRSAEKLAAAGRWEESLHAWRQAWANSPGDPALTRGWLLTALNCPAAPKLGPQAYGQAAWLWRLANTNRADVELTARVFRRCRMQSVLLRWLAGLEADLAPATEAEYVKCLFDVGRFEQFAQRWRAAEKRLPQEPELPLYGAAYLAAWGPPETASEGRQRLAAAAVGGSHAVLANRLLVSVSWQLQDEAGCQAAAQRLQEAHADTLGDHLIHWRLLIALGRREEAKRLIEFNSALPASATEALRAAETCVALGLEQRARQLLALFLNQGGFDLDLCVKYAGLLLEAKLWEEASSLALGMRAHPTLPGSMIAFTHYLEGRALLGRGELKAAAAAFDQAAALECDEPALGLTVADSLVELGFARPAGALLQQLQPKLADEPAYWLALTKVAHAQRDAALLLRATERACSLDPRNAVAANNYAAALLINRAQPDEAIRVTRQLLQQMPAALVPRVNHASALLLNRRTTEAQGLLAGVDTSRLTADEASQYHRAMFEVCLNLGKTNEARAAYDRVDKAQLYPVQAQWLEAAAKGLPPR